MKKSKTVRVCGSIEISKSKAQVFGFVATDFFTNYPKWALEVIKFKPPYFDGMTVGLQAKQTRYDQGQESNTTIEVTCYTPQDEIDFKALDAPFQESYYFSVLSDNSTQLTFCFELLEIDVFMRPFEKLIRRSIEEGIENSLSNICNLITNEQPSKVDFFPV